MQRMLSGYGSSPPQKMPLGQEQAGGPQGARRRLDAANANSLPTSAAMVPTAPAASPTSPDAPINPMNAGAYTGGPAAAGGGGDLMQLLQSLMGQSGQAPGMMPQPPMGMGRRQLQPGGMT